MFKLNTKLFRRDRSRSREGTFKPRFDALEQREVMSTLVSGVLAGSIASSSITSVLGNLWPQPTTAGLALINSLPNSTVRAAALSDYQRDGYISRNDMLDILSTGTTNYTSATSPVFTSLSTLVSNGSTVGMPGYVQSLASKTLSSAHGLLLGEIKAMQEDDVGQAAYNYFVAHENKTLAEDIDMEVGRWFLGQDHPNDSFVNSQGQTITPTYQAVNLPLWNGSPVYQDVAQGFVGDCWLMASLAEVAARNPGDITSMFIDNGDHTYTVRLFNGSTPDYLTVDNMLPGGGNTYAHPQGDLWVALAEKAYAQENAFGWIGSSHQGVESYGALSGGYPQWALPAITGLSAPSYDVNANSVMNAFLQGSFVVMCTGDSPNSSQVVPDHCYALLNYNGTTSSFTLFNPWGVGGGHSAANNQFYPGMINVTCAQLPGDFDSWAKAGSASAPTQSTTISAVVPTDAAKPSMSSVTQDSFHQERRDVFVADADVPLHQAMLHALSKIGYGGEAASTEAGTDISSSLDVFSAN
jgi:hypothetical protein